LDSASPINSAATALTASRITSAWSSPNTFLSHCPQLLDKFGRLSASHGRSVGLISALISVTCALVGAWTGVAVKAEFDDPQKTRVIVSCAARWHTPSQASGPSPARWPALDVEQVGVVTQLRSAEGQVGRKALATALGVSSEARVRPWAVVMLGEQGTINARVGSGYAISEPGDPAWNARR
jgi:hypothetical protein